MKNYIWLPVYTDEMMSMATVWNNGLKRKGKDEFQLLFTPVEQGIRKGIYRKLKGGCLKAVLPNDKVYILLHGSGVACGRKIGARRSRDKLMKSYTPAELTNLMIKENLTRKIIEINLFCCGSGLGGNESFAARLKKTMLTKGFHSVVVTGYLGDVVPSFVQRYTSASGDSYTQDTHKGVTVGDIVKYTLPASLKKERF